MSSFKTDEINAQKAQISLVLRDSQSIPLAPVSNSQIKGFCVYNGFQI